MADSGIQITGLLRGTGREILTHAIFWMGILYLAYVISWPILPEERIRALPWLLLVVVGLAPTGWLLWRRFHAASIGRRKTDQRHFPWRLPLPEFLVRAIKEIRTQTILCMGGAFAVMAIFVPFMRTEPVGVSPLGPLVFLFLVATCWMGEQWSRKRRQSGGGRTGHPAAPRTSF